MRFRSNQAARWVWLSALLWIFAAGCNAAARGAPPPATQISSPAASLPTLEQPIATLTPSPTTTLFRLPTHTPTATNVPVTPLPSATPICQDGLLFIEDLTIPDGTLVAPGEIIDKRWKVANNGSCNWDERYRLRRISGPDLGVADEQALFPARAGREAIIRMILTAPDDPGTYRSAWQAYNPLGEPFGDPIFVEIIVASSP